MEEKDHRLFTKGNAEPTAAGLKRPSKRRFAKMLIEKGRKTRARIRVAVACSVVMAGAALLLE